MNVAGSKSPDRTRRILYIITKPAWGGAQRYVYDLACASLEQGYDTMVACGSQGELTKRLIEAKVPVLFVPGLGRDVAPLSDIRAFLTLTRLMASMQPDIVHANSSKAGLLATVAARLSGVPRIIFTAHGWAFNESRPWWQRQIFKFFHIVTVAASDTVICVSDAVRKDAERLPFTKNKLQVIHNGIRAEDGIHLADKEQARAKLAPAGSPILNYPFWIGTLAELHPTKGIDTAIAAFAQIAPQFPHTALVLIGEGQQRNKLVEVARSYNIQDRILFAGHVPHAARLLPALEIFLFPSRSEALGYAVLEAGNASLPVVASNVGGIPEILENDTLGRLISVGDVQGFAEALTTLIQNPEERVRLGKALHERVRSQFSQAHMIKQTLALYT